MVHGDSWCVGYSSHCYGRIPNQISSREALASPSWHGGYSNWDGSIHGGGNVRAKLARIPEDRDARLGYLTQGLNLVQRFRGPQNNASSSGHQGIKHMSPRDFSHPGQDPWDFPNTWKLLTAAKPYLQASRREGNGPWMRQKWQGEKIHFLQATHSL